MSDRIGGALVALLLVALALQAFLVLSHRSGRPLAVVLPYRAEDLERGTEPPSSKGGAAGPAMTTDDLVRGLLSLCEHGDASLQLTERQRARLLPLVREAAARKERLHVLRKRQEELGRALTAGGIAVAGALSPAQLDAILSNRDETERLLRDLPGLKARLPRGSTR